MIYVLLETYYGQTKPVFVCHGPAKAIAEIERRAALVAAERQPDVESESLVRCYNNSAAYVYDLYKMKPE